MPGAFVAKKANREEFLRRLRAEFPAVYAGIYKCSRGLLHCEIGHLARATQEAIDSGDKPVVKQHIAFVDALLRDAGPKLESAIVVSYLEYLDFDGQKSAPAKARDLLTPRLRTALQDLELYLEELFKDHS